MGSVKVLHEHVVRGSGSPTWSAYTDHNPVEARLAKGWVFRQLLRVLGKRKRPHWALLRGVGDGRRLAKRGVSHWREREKKKQERGGLTEVETEEGKKAGRPETSLKARNNGDKKKNEGQSDENIESNVPVDGPSKGRVRLQLSVYGNKALFGAGGLSQQHKRGEPKRDLQKLARPRLRKTMGRVKQEGGRGGDKKASRKIECRVLSQS